MAGFHSRPRQHSRLLEPDHCRRLWEMPCILQLAVKAVFMEPGSCTQLRAAEPCCGSRLHVAGFYSRTRADGYQDPATRPGPAVTTRMQRARPRFNFSITTRMIAAAPASSSLKHACSSPQCTDERATAVPSIGPTLFGDRAALSFHQTFDRIADGAHVAAGTSVHVSGVTANTSGGMGHTIGWARLANILDRGCFTGEV